jgi:hypothetical protein
MVIYVDAAVSAITIDTKIGNLGKIRGSDEFNTLRICSTGYPVKLEPIDFNIMACSRDRNTNQEFLGIRGFLHPDIFKP